MGDFQLRTLQAKLAELEAAGRAKDAELRDLREIADAAATLQSQDVHTAKIIELSKKNRALSMALDKEKLKVAKLQSDLHAAAGVAAGGGRGAAPAAAGAGLDPDAVEDIARSMVEKAAEAAEAAAKEAAQWRDRCQQQTNKMAQLEQKAFGLEIENKKLQRALVREVGDDVPLSKILEAGEGGSSSSSSDWKGRRETIIALKDQLQALKAAQGLAPDSRHEMAARKVLTKVAGARTAELDRVSAELAAARAEADTQRARAEGALSRRKIVENELAGLKEKVAVVLTKTQNDDQLIAALRQEIEALRGGANKPSSRGSNGGTRAGAPGSNDTISDHDALWREVSGLRRRCADQGLQVERQQAIILALQHKLAAASSICTDGGGSNSNSGGWGEGVAVGAGPGRPRSSGLQANCSSAALRVGNSSSQAAQLRVAEVQVARLQELVKLLRERVAELEAGEG